MTTSAHEMTKVEKVEADWIESTLTDLGLDLESCPADTLRALRQAWKRISDEHADERKTEIQPEIPDEPSKARGPKVRKPPPRRRGQRRGTWGGVKNRDAEISDKQVALLLDLKDDYGQPLLLTMGRKVGILWGKAPVTEETLRQWIKRGPASDWIGAMLKAQKAGEIDKL